jgi:tetratricopeptide (TPR) repeat protein
MNMKLKYYHIGTAVILFFFLLSSNVYGQSKFQGLIRVNKNQVSPSKGTVYFDMDILLNGVDVSTNNQLVLTPVLRTTSGKSQALPSVIINGKKRHNLYQRSLTLSGQKSDPTIYRVLRADKKKVIMSIPYKTTVPYEKWMKDAAIYLVEDLCGCGGSNEAYEELLVSDLGQPTLDYDYIPAVQFIIPPRENIKVRYETGYAYVVFEVDKWEILPNLKVGNFDNRLELQKIKNSLSYVSDEPSARITDISIIAHASPEDTYEHNMMLSKNRAKSLLDYITKNYNIPSSVKISSEGKGENWTDLITYIIEDPKVEYKEQVLRIIRTVNIFDGREKQLMDLAGGRPYRYMLNNIFPLLRRSDYKISYTVPAVVSIEKGKELLKTKPEMLSLEEMYLIADTYEQGSPEFNEVFDIAVRYFQDDMIANLNAAAAALLGGKTAYAKRILEKYEDEPTAWNNLGVVYMAEHRFDEAEKYLQEAARKGNAEARQNLGLLPELKSAYEKYQREKAGYEDYR